MEDSEVADDYIDMGSMNSAIMAMQLEKSLTSAHTSGSVSSYDSQQKTPDNIKPEIEHVYQLPKANPTPSPHIQHIVSPLLPPKSPKQTKTSKTAPHYPPQSPLSSPQGQEAATATQIVHSPTPDDNTAIQFSKENDRNDRKSSPAPKKTEQQDESSEKPLDLDVPPRNILRPRSPLEKEEITNSPNEAIQLHASNNDANGLTQSDATNMASDPDDKKSSSEPGESEQLNKFSVDLDVPPRNILRPRSPLEKDELVTSTNEAIQLHASDDANQSDVTNMVEGSGDNKSPAELNKTEEQKSAHPYQPIIIAPLMPSTIYDKPFVNEHLVLPPRNSIKPKAPSSPLPTSLGMADEDANATPVNAAIQSPTSSDVTDEVAQSCKANDSHKADDTQPFSKPDDRYKTLPRSSVPSSPSQIPVPSSPSQILVPSSPSQIPPKNILRSKPNNPQSPPLPDKEKVQDKIIAVKQDKAQSLVTPPRNLNPYIIDPRLSRTVRCTDDLYICQPQKESTSQDGNNTQEAAEDSPSEQSYTLENFVKIYPLPQLVSVTEGHYGDTDDFTMSEGMEIILFFKKSTQAVTATARHTDKTYYIPVNCSLQVSPYQHDSKEHLTKSYYYSTVKHLLHRKDGLPMVVKVLKGRKSAPALNAGELLFPKGLSSKGTHLKFTDIKKEDLRLKLSCDIGFSTKPSDTKMHLADYVENINLFPSSIMVFCDSEVRRTMFEIHTGMELVLQESKMLYSCICSTDVLGENNYPLIEVLTALPIEVKPIKSPTVELDPIYDTAKRIYETFDLSMIETSMFLDQHDDEHDYTEIKKTEKDYQTLDRVRSSCYNLELPMGVYATSRRMSSSDMVEYGRFMSKATSPPLPPRYNIPTSCRVPTGTKIFQHKNQPARDPLEEEYVYTSTADERRFYIRSFTVNDVLQLLDKMNLGQFKGIFQLNNVDGRTLLLFTKYELEAMGIKDRTTQKQLLDVISGHSKPLK